MEADSAATEVWMVAKVMATFSTTPASMFTSSRNFMATSLSASGGHSENQLMVVHETSAGNIRT